MRRILHVDLDSFYASVEIREKPELAGKPVIVGADPKGGTGRGVVTTASYEARTFGIRSAMPISKAWRLCPDAVFLRPRFALYNRVSNAVFRILEETGAAVEAASIDEAYLDASAIAPDLEETEALAHRIQEAIRERERITASVGVATNKLVAKIASDHKKPAGRTVVREGEEERFLAPLSVRKIPGVGPKTEALLHDSRITTCAELARADPLSLAGKLGRWGPRLTELARGIDHAPVVPEWQRKSSGSETTFPEDVVDLDRLLSTVRELSEDAVQGLASERLAARTVTIKIRLGDFTTFTRSRTLPSPTTDARTIFETARELLVESLPESRPIRLLGVRLTQLVDATTRQLTLDSWPADVCGAVESEFREPGFRWP